MNSRFTAIAIFIGMVLVLVSPPARSVEFTEQEFAKLHAGKTVKKPYAESCKNGYYGGMGWVVIDAPADVIWNALQDWQSYPKFFPRTVSANELSSSGKNSIVRMEMGYRILNLEYSLNVIREEDGRRVSFSLARNQPHDVEDTKGYWHLIPQQDGSTLVAYAVSVRIPRWISVFLGDRMEKKVERNLIGLPGYLKEWVEGPSGNRYRRLTAKR